MDNIWTTQNNIWPTVLASVGQTGQRWTTVLYNVGQRWPNWPTLNNTWPTLDNIGQHLANTVVQLLASLANIEQHCCSTVVQLLFCVVLCCPVLYVVAGGRRMTLAESIFSPSACRHECAPIKARVRLERSCSGEQCITTQQVYHTTYMRNHNNLETK